MSNTEKDTIDWHKIFDKLDLDICILIKIVGPNQNSAQSERKKESF